MSDAETVLPRIGASTAIPTASQFAARWFASISDRLNPILVKESRQALKGRAFATTFMAVLILAWTWSIFGVALQSPGIFYAPGGAYMLMGFLVVLAIPLIIVIPFSAFRSMAAEREDGTFELLSITNLKPWQLVTGKLGSVVLQIAIYLSALAPCIAFTYFLRGIDIFMIATLVAVAILESLLLSALGLLMAAQTRPQRMQNASSVVLLLLLVFAAFMSCSVAFAALASGVTIPVRDPNTWIAAAAVFSTWTSLLWLFILASAAAVTFASDNRSTLLRVATMSTHALWFGWVTWAWQSADHQAEVVYVYLIPMSVFWWFCGSCVSGERTVLTPRVRRSLPESTLARMFTVLFFPGRGLGYFFVVGNVLTMGLMSMVLGSLSSRVGGSGEGIATSSILAMGYLISYLGLGNLLLRWSGTYNLEGPARGLFANVVIIIFGSLVPLSIHLFYPRTFGQEYSVIETSNVFWTMAESIDGDLSSIAGTTFFPVPFVVAMAAVLMLLINLLLAAQEMLISRSNVPQRVFDEVTRTDHSTTLPQNPWDERPNRGL